MSITLKDIAKRAKVNVSTVSKALNDSPEISTETIIRVKKIAQALNYTPNLAARALVGKGTKTLGLIIPEVSSNYFVKILNSVEDELKRIEYSLIIGITDFNVKEEIRYLDLFAGRSVDGILVAGSYYKEVAKKVKELTKSYDIPIIFIQSFVHFDQFDYIMIDDAHGINKAVSYLKENGHTHIGFIGDKTADMVRQPMFKAAMEQNELAYDPAMVMRSNSRFEQAGYAGMKELLKSGNVPTAIVAQYDNVAIGAMKAAYEQGLSIPEDISFIGYDNIRESEFLECALTTISPPAQDMARIGVKLIIGKINDKKIVATQQVKLLPELIIRESVNNRL
ncbi:MAG: LacI family DNA-binding transcriptional regulator [Eubacteriales bacterium]